MKKTILASALLLAVGSAHAAESVRWDSVSLAYQSVDVDGDKLTGFGVSATKLLGTNVFIGAGYSSVSDDVELLGSIMDLDFNSLSVGLGYRHGITGTTDVFGAVSYQDFEIEASYQGQSVSESDSGYGLEAGVRSLVTHQLELGASLMYTDVGDESETGFKLSATLHLTEHLSLGAGYGKADDVDTLSASASLFF